MRHSDRAKQRFTDKSTTPEHDKIVLWMYEKLKDPEYIKRVFNYQDVAHLQVKIEPAITVSNKQIAYADLFISFLGWRGQYWFRNKKNLIEVSKSKYSDDFEITNQRIDNEISIYFEIKTNLNVGEAIRQINFMKSGAYHENTFFVVVAPPNLHSKILIEQKIGFIPYV